MAKAFGEHERSAIRSRLVDSALRSLAGKGFQSTTVDELASSAGISKGAFYQFFPSKEVLFFAVVMDFHERVEEGLVKDIVLLDEPGPEALSRLLLGVFKNLASSFLPRFIESGELEILMRRLPPELVVEHHGSDDDFFSRIAAVLPALSGLDASRIPVWAATLRAIFLSLLHRREIGEGLFEEVLAVLLEGVVERMFKEAEQGARV